MVPKHKGSQKLVFKITTTRLKKAKWNLTLSLADARRNEELIALSDSQMFSWIDELRGIEDVDGQVAEVRRQIKALRSQPNSLENRRAIQRLYQRLDDLQFKPDYMHLVVEKNADFRVACKKGFVINGIRYARLLGTAGGVKNSTIVFVNAELVEELRKRIDNGRDKSVPMVPAKLEAYRALTCSSSMPVSMPKGILVVKDVHTVYREDIVMLNDEDSDEPVMQILRDYEADNDATDGFGLMLPELAERWSNELGLGYTTCGMNTRLSWMKGMVFTFPFLEFGETVAGGNYITHDVWGTERDLRDIELIITESMLKMWFCYPNLESYLANMTENHYQFRITKVCPEKLEHCRTMNYQFINPLNLTDEQIDDLIRPTVEEIKGVIDGDWAKAILFFRGLHLNDANVEHDLETSPAIDSVMIDQRMFHDPYVRRSLYGLIKQRIVRAKIGALSVHGNYSIICGDPYLLCQSVYGLEPTGLLKAGEIYNKYWLDYGSPEVACFRAPMSAAANIRKRRIANREDVLYWYRYITTGTILNGFDSTCAALNGAD